MRIVGTPLLTIGRRRTLVAGAAACLAAASGVIGLLAPAGAAAAAGLSWRACPYPQAPKDLRCAAISVPVDYAHPQGPRTRVVIDRLPAADPSQRIGSLVFDPGGPGASGTYLVYKQAQGAPLFTPAVRRRYDLIGLDPRGVGLSDPLRCSYRLFDQRVDLFPRDEHQFAALIRHNRALGRSCLKDSGPLAAHVDTRSVARDFDAIRRELGQPRLDYLGLSYGTEIGTEYAALYPRRVGRMALDGVLAHSLSQAAMVREESAAYATEFTRFAAWCDHSSACVLRGHDPLGSFGRLAEAADKTPIPAPGCRSGHCAIKVSGEDIRADAQGLILFPPPSIVSAGWPGLATAIAQAEHGNATALSPPRATSDADPAISASGLAIECQDFPSHDTFAQLRRLGDQIRRADPATGGLSQSYEVAAECDGWPLAAHFPPQPFPRPHTAPILLTSATHDPSTAHAWALDVHRQLPNSVLVTRRGDGHTSYFTPGATQATITRYLTTGKLPEPDRVRRRLGL
jgi:pimeloyl-ACP methyl ester carboxylesterase